MSTSFPPIADYGFLSDCHSAALVAEDGSVEWACFGRFDDDPIFARVLDRDRGGWYRIGPRGGTDVRRRYLPDTNVIETTFRSSSGVFTVTDCLPLAPFPGQGDPGARPPGSRRLVRLVHALEGRPEVELEFRPRPSFGLTTPEIDLVQSDLAVARGGPAAALLETDLGPLTTDGATCVTSARLEPGDSRYAVLTVTEAVDVVPTRLTCRVASRLVEETVAYWRRWVSLGTFPSEYREPVVRAALLLKALTNATTGAIAAAGTTSLPEELGGIRNWDYRFCWLRDSAFVLKALLDLGYRDEVDAYGEWLNRSTAGRAEELQIMYGLGGERLLHEAEVEHLSGYRNSRPVRIGNGAWDQFQLDTYGELVGAAYLASEGVRRHEEQVWHDWLADVVEVTARRWTEPDEGIWEVRGERQHFTFSKLMAWVALDRGIVLEEHAGRVPPQTLDRWRRTRADIRAAIERDGVDPDTGAFTQAFGSRDLDASTLLLGLTGFVPTDDPRHVATVEAVERELTVNGHVYRYRSDDGLCGDEGTFVFCTLWQARALATIGRVDEARARLELVLDSATELGVIAEEIDPHDGSQLGNTPQAFSHCGVITAALAIEAAAAGEPITPYFRLPGE